jgi:hypothetical protein
LGGAVAVTAAALAGARGELRGGEVVAGEGKVQGVRSSQGEAAVAEQGSGIATCNMHALDALWTRPERVR